MEGGKEVNCMYLNNSSAQEIFAAIGNIEELTELLKGCRKNAKTTTEIATIVQRAKDSQSSLNQFGMQGPI
jgi:hypothetical protein